MVILTKTNTGTLSIVTDNNNTGSTVIEQGKIRVGTNGITGTISGSVSVNTNGTFEYSRADDRDPQRRAHRQRFIPPYR